MTFKLTRRYTVCSIYEQLSELPAFNPDNEGANAGAAVADLRRQLADAVLFCTPEYAGPLPGSLKNLLDRTAGLLAGSVKIVRHARAAPRQ